MTEPRNYLAEAIGIARGESRLIATEEHVKALYGAWLQLRNDTDAFLEACDKILGHRAGERQQEIAFADCKNPDCPIGCPDSHCLPFEEEPDIERDRR